MAQFTLNIPVDINGTEDDFINEVITQNLGDALQVLAKGRVQDFAVVTFDQKKEYVITKFGEQYENIFLNAMLERSTQAMRESALENEKHRKGKAGKPNG